MLGASSTLSLNLNELTFLAQTIMENKAIFISLYSLHDSPLKFKRIRLAG